MVSTLDAAKRVLVVLLRTLAATYNCAVGVTRDSSDAVIRKAYRTMSLKTHPDKGGAEEDQGGSEQALGQAGSAPNAQVHPTCSPQAPKEPRRMAREGPHRQLDSGNDWPVVTRKQVDDLQ